MLCGINGTFRSKTLCRIDLEKKIVFFYHSRLCLFNSPDTMEHYGRFIGRSKLFVLTY